ncbi:MAG: DUF423 domain-containing protein [bacterium]|nr:DUF423 domain-containing protein [bacterium]
METTFPSKKLATIGILGATAVALGALGAHALKNQLAGGLLTEDQLSGFETATKYQLFHTLGMLLIILLQQHMSSKYFVWAYCFFLIGIILFSGSLYLLCTRGLMGMEELKMLGPITPLGGISFMAGWLCLTLAAFKKS